jgi:hypothetical protein
LSQDREKFQDVEIFLEQKYIPAGNAGMGEGIIPSARMAV